MKALPRFLDDDSSDVIPNPENTTTSGLLTDVLAMSMRAMDSDDKLLQYQLESLACTPSSNTSVGEWISCSSSICMSLPKPIHSSKESENSSELDESASSFTDLEDR
jgi:hypothetical protein